MSLYKQSLYRLKLIGAWFLRRLAVYNQGDKPNILLFSSRRSGSTHLAEMISIDTGVWFVNEPCAIRYPNTPKGQLTSSLLPSVTCCQFVRATEQVEQSLKHLLTEVQDANYRQLGRLRRPRYGLFADRTLIKMVNATPLLPWASEEFSAQVVHLVRHPGAQAQSLLRNNWPITTQAFIEDEVFLEQYFTREQVNRALEVHRSGSKWEQAILNWILDNVPSLRNAPTQTFRVTYEELTLSPRAVVPVIAERLDLRSVDRMLCHTGRPSSSSKFSRNASREAIRTGDTSHLVTKWVDKMSSEEKSQAQHLLEFFEIHEYSMHATMPHNSLLIVSTGM